MKTDALYRNNYALLFERCHKGDVNFIHENCDFDLINVQNASGLTLTALACLNDDSSMLHELMKFMPDVNLKTNNGHSAATFAIANNNLQHLKLLVENNDDFDFKDQKIIESVLLAIIKNQEDIVAYLISKGLEINASDKNKNNVLMYACRYGSVRITKLALSRQINVNSKNSTRNTALLIATERNHLACVEMLIEAGAQINVHNKDNLTPLILAVKYQYRKLIDYLLEQRDVFINAQDNNGTSALMFAVLNNDVASVYLLLQKPEIDLELVNKENQTALMLAIKKDFYDIALLLIRAGAFQRGVDKYNMTCLGYAKRNKNYRLVKKLTFDEDEDLEGIKNRIISKLNEEIQNLEDSIQESIFTNIDKLAKKQEIAKKQVNVEKMKTTTIIKEGKNPVLQNLSEDFELAKPNKMRQHDNAINHVLLNDDFLIPLKKSRKSKAELFNDYKSESEKTQQEIEDQLLMNLIDQLERKFGVKLKPNEVDRMDFKDIILTLILKRKKQIKQSKQKQNQPTMSISLDAMKENEE